MKMPRSNRSKAKRRKLRQRRPYSSSRHVGPVPVAVEHYSSVTFTPDGEGSNSSNEDSALEDYMQNMKSNPEASISVDAMESMVVNDHEAVTRLTRLSMNFQPALESRGGSDMDDCPMSPLTYKSQRRRLLSARGKRKWKDTCSENGSKRACRLQPTNDGSVCAPFNMPSIVVSPAQNMMTLIESREGMSTCAGKGSSDASRSASPSEACPPDTDISESDDERSCDADDELSCVESSHSHTIAWWDEVDMCLGGSELSAEREQGDLLEMALDSLSLAGRRGFQRHMTLAQLRASGAKRYAGTKKDPESAQCITNSRQLKQVISKFVCSDSRKQMQLPAMQPYLQDPLAQLVSAYQLRCHLKGPVTVVSKTKRTKSPSSVHLRDILYSSPSPKGHSSSTSFDATNSSVSSDARHHPIGPPLSDNNLGRRMLTGMGWQPGTGLGQDNHGIVEPVSAYRQSGRQGFS